MTIHVIPARQTFGDTCKHYDVGERGAVKRPECCKAGVRYADVTIDGEWKYRDARSGKNGPVYTHRRCSPCNRAYNFGGAVCGKAEFPTEQEVAEWLEETNRLFNRVAVARRAIIEHMSERFGGDSIKCPCCDGGTLAFTRARSNGHVHAQCSTPGCVAWME